MWRVPLRGWVVAALLGATLARGHTRADAVTMETRLHDAMLVAAAGVVRLAEPRVTGGFAHAPWRVATSTDAAPRVPSSLYAAAAHLERIAEDHPRADVLRSLGVAYLLTRPDDAVDTLERALSAAPDDSRTLSDLAAALLVRSRAPEDTWDAVRALHYAERAWRLAPDLREAAFNAALARERMHLRSEARKAWRAVQRLDAGSGWASEATARVADLSAETVAERWPSVKADLTQRITRHAPIDAGGLARQYPQAIREYVQEELLPAWGAAVLADDGTAASPLSTARVLCTALAVHGDSSCRLSLRAIDAADPVRLGHLATAYEAWGRALRVYRTHDFARAQPLFALADAQFVAGRSPDHRWCGVYLAILEGRFGDAANSARRLDAVLPLVTRDDKALRGRVKWLLGLHDINSERFSSGLAHYAEARAAFREAGEFENLARVELLTAEALMKIGTRRDGWQYVDHALQRLDAVYSVPARQVIFVGASISGLHDDVPEAVRAFQDEFIGGLRDPVAHPAALTEGLLYYFASQTGTGATEGAENNLRLARRAMATVPDQTARLRLEAEIAFWEGRALIPSDRDRAIAQLTRTIDLFDRLKLHDRLPVLFQARGRAHLLAHETSAARQDLFRGIAAVETRARDMSDETQRPSALGVAWPLVTDLIRMELDQGRPVAALALAERVRGLSLGATESPCANSDDGESPRCWIAHLPPSRAVVSYVLLPDQIVIWIATDQGVRVVRHAVSASVLRAWVQDVRRRTTDGRGRADDGATALFEALIRPVLPLIRARTELVIVPDDVLHGLPFAALLDASTRRYLVEDHVVAIAPSVTHASRTAPTAATDEDDATRALVVANPAAHGVIAGRLPRLPGADMEAARLAALFRDVRVLQGPEATKARLRSALSDVDILHVASHALVNHRVPSRSYFVLAPEPEDEGESLLFMSELSALPLQRLRLAVLAACGSADGSTASGGTTMSLARPFLSAGVPTVVATLWPVGDRASAALFERFYERLAAGAAPAAALHDAQLAMLHANDPGLRNPVAWSSFVSIGGLLPMSQTVR